MFPYRFNQWLYEDDLIDHTAPEATEEEQQDKKVDEDTNAKGDDSKNRNNTSVSNNVDISQ
jgi:hypothetical protein